MTDKYLLSRISAEDGDFLPDLCGPQAVLSLILVSELLVGSLVVASFGVERFDWARFGLVSILVLWVVLTCAGSLCVLRPLLRKLHPVVAGMGSYCLSLFYTLAFTVLVFWINNGNLEGVQSQIVGNLMVAAVLAGIGLRYLYLQQQLRNQQKAEMQSRIQALQSRIRPHFLFNSMNSIASLIAVDQDTAERMVVELSQLFRASLSEPGLIPLHQEIDLCRYYIDIEQMRLAERLKVEWHLHQESGEVLSEHDPEYRALQIPSFLLQPLVENAIYHGVQPLPEGGTITIELVLTKRAVEICIRNPITEEEDKTLQLDGTRRTGNGIALDNIRHRLAAYYLGAGSLKVTTGQKEFTTCIRYPLKRPV
ncbi:sensor histidine kinase [Teredinibacter purpureus]|uniref:sensor histidine kinase n=1 Tax=Teredinibacter purpureus TaxID=2731756 RepID=UPI00069751AD|nr:histidine kinase [Teredinibacter purpureus]